LFVRWKIENGVKYYVEFFGSNTHKAWCMDTYLIKYEGVKAFMQYAQNQVDSAPTKQLKECLVDHFQLNIELKIRKQWENALNEANKFLIYKQQQQAEQQAEKEQQHILLNNNNKRKLENYLILNNSTTTTTATTAINNNNGRCCSNYIHNQIEQEVDEINEYEEATNDHDLRVYNKRKVNHHLNSDERNQTAFRGGGGGRAAAAATTATTTSTATATKCAYYYSNPSSNDPINNNHIHENYEHRNLYQNHHHHHYQAYSSHGQHHNNGKKKSLTCMVNFKRFVSL
jgi:hypothetical protein